MNLGKANYLCMLCPEKVEEMVENTCNVLHKVFHSLCFRPQVTDLMNSMIKVCIMLPVREVSHEILLSIVKL